MSGPPDLSPRDAVERWLDRKRVELADATVRDYGYRLGQFVEWCEERGVESVRDLSGWELDSYEQFRRRNDVAAVTLSNELTTLRQLIEYCERIELVEDGLAGKIEVPSIDEEDEVSDKKLEADAAEGLLSAFRDSPDYASREHVFLEIAWYTSARVGAIRSLDVGHFDREQRTVRFVDRPKHGTPLKNANDGERIVGLPEPATAVVSEWVDYNRPPAADEYGREPLLATEEGRPVTSTLRDWCYYATTPCRYRDCPHGEVQHSCDWFARTEASRCPSTVSPHRVRTGSMTWQRSQGVPIEVVAKRANASPEVIRKHYDHPTQQEDFEQRRRPYLDRLAFDADGATDENTEDSDS